MDGAMGKEEEVVEAVLTCEGDFHDPELLIQLEKFRLKLTDLLLADEAKLNLKKVEPWNSVKVTFTIPREAALRLRQLAQSGNEVLRQMGVLSVQIQGDSSISLKIVGRNNETTELMLHTPRTPSSSSSLPSERGANTSTANEISSPGPSNEEVTRRNIVDYLIQGPNAIFNSILGANAPTAFPTPHKGVAAAPDSFSGVGSSRPIQRPNSMANVVPQPNPILRGSHPGSYPFAKTSGAFHIPIPHQSSAGQSSSDFPNSLPVNNTQGHINSSGFQNSGSQQKNIPGTTNVFGAKSSVSSNVSETLPPSSSPGFMIDLPPPPPYPHNSSNSSNKMGKQVSATSPLLVNLLQTDPIAVSAGMASASTLKTVTVGNTSPAPPAKKKKRSKKPKESVPIQNTFSNMDDIPSKDLLGTNTIFNPTLSAETARIPDPSASFSSKLQKEYFPGSAQTAQSFSTIHRPDVESTAVSDKSFKPLISSGRPCNENSVNNSAFSLSKFNSSVGSAIGTDHVRSSEVNGPRELSQELIDSFSKEIAAGKIINPYTGQLEPRDSLPEGNSGKFKEDMISCVFPNKAREIGNPNYSDVPVSISQMMDINVLRSMSTASSSTAALFHSGSTLHLTSEKHPSQFPPHRRIFSDNNVGTNKNIYAAKVNSKADNDSFINSLSSTWSQSNLNSHQVSANSIQNQVKSSNSSSVPGPGSSLTKVQGRPALSQHVLPSHTVPSSLLSSGVSESVINSKSGSLCSSTTLPVTHKDSFVKHSEHNPSLFQLTSCANSNTQSSVPHHPHSTKVFSSSSQSVVQTRPVLSQAQSSLQASGRLISSDVSKSIPSQHVQAATSDPISSGTKTNFPHLLNSLPEKSIDQQNMIQSSLEKVSPEGDDNSNHSGLVSENLPENSGTSVLLEHAGVKVENHDSGVGSSSERSDDTPSEPGDGEFRANNSCSESEEANKSTKRLASFKADMGSDSSSTNTITVGYMMSSLDNASHLKSSQIRDKQEDIKTTTVSLATSSSNSKLDNSFSTQINSLHKRSELSSSHPLTSADWMIRDTQMQSSTYSDKMKLNGPLTVEKEDGLRSTKKDFQLDTKLNGPSSNEVDEMLLTIQGLQEKNEQIPSKNSPAFKRHLQHEVLEEMVKLQQFAASKELSNTQGKLDKEDSSDAMHRNMVGNDDRHDHLPFFDMEDLVNGKLFGNGTPNVDNKTGSNITSIYSKRSSPVNVNMLNHIYAPGLPLPRRLTESVQRLVKPLPTSESSIPQMRLCKSPGVGSPRAGTSPNGPSPSRMALHSGTRSPGSSIPKLIPYDKHSLLSGGLDLAGLSKFPPNSLPLSELASENTSSDASSRMLGLTTDFLSRDGQTHGFLSSCHVSPPLLTDSLAHTQKMLSQSYPPHKSRDLSNNVSIHDLFSCIQQPHQSSSKSWQDSSTHLLKSSSEPMISSQLSQGAVQRNLKNTPNSVVQSDSFSLSTVSHSSHTHVTSTETFTTTESVLSKSSKTTYSGSSLSSPSPNHSRSTSPTSLANSNRLESSIVSKTNSLAFKTASDTGGLLPHWAKISLNNGSKNSSNQKIAVSSQKNVPYVTLSSSSVAGSAVHAAQSVSSRITPAVCSALLSGSVVGNTPNSSIDNLAVLKSSKPDPSPSSRAVNKSDFSLNRSSPIASALSRNLFESVSCDLTSIPYNVQTSRNKALDTLVSHSSSKSVLDLNHAQDLNIQSPKGQRKKSDSSQGHMSPPLNFHSDINSLQSIRTNETPSTSLPAQVVHLDFPHLPPTVSETAISNSVVDHILPVKSPVPSSNNISHDWNSTLANPTTSVPSFPVKTSPISKINHPHTLVTLDKKDLQTKNIQRTLSPPLIKEPILETLASALGSLNKMNEQNPEVKSSNLPPVTAPVDSVRIDEKEIVSEVILPDVSNKGTMDSEVPSLSCEPITTPKIITRKRGSHLMDEHTDVAEDSCSAAKHFAMEPTNILESDSSTNVISDEFTSSEVIGEKTVSSPNSYPMEAKEQQKEIESPLPGQADLFDEFKDNEKEEKTLAHVHDVPEFKNSSQDQQCDIKTPQNKDLEDKSIPVLSSEEGVSSESVDNNLHETITEPAEGRHYEETFSHESESKMLDSSNADTIFNISTLSTPISLQELSSRDSDTPKEKDLEEEKLVKLDNANTMTENKGNQLIEDTLELEKGKNDIDSLHDPDSLVSNVNAEPKLEDGNRKGHRSKRQFYAYVPEKSIDQTYFDTPILSGRTRSRNKPSEPAGNSENTVNQEGHNATTSSSDSQVTAVSTGAKSEITDAGSKRSTRSLRTKDNSQDLTANKRRRLQTRDHR